MDQDVSSMFNLPAVKHSPGCRTMNNISNDILGTIFEACISHEPEFDWNAAPLLLLRVCRRWKTVALTVPALWSNIHPSYSHPSLIALWLKRSQQHSLTLRTEFIHDRLDDPAISARKAAAFDLFLGETYRWKHVNFTMGAMQATKMVAGMGPNSAPLLHSLTLDLDECPEHLILKLGDVVSTACPNLNTLDLTANCTSSRSLMRFPVDRVSQISVTGAFAEAATTDFITLCSNAESITVSSYMRMGTHSPIFPPAVMRNLKSLHLDTHVDPVAILSNFDFPSLRSLKVVCYPGLKYRRNLIAFLEMAGYRLDRLQLYDMDKEYSEWDLLQIMDCPPVSTATDVELWCLRGGDDVKRMSIINHPPPQVIMTKWPIGATREWMEGKLHPRTFDRPS